MESSFSDRIEKSCTLGSPVSRVWRALTDHREFGTWFLAELESPFVPGQTTLGRLTVPGYEHLTMEIHVQEIEPEKRFSFKWHPYAIDPEVDYSHEAPTLVVFSLEGVDEKTSLTITESGFTSLPQERQHEAFEMHDGGWTEQLKNIEQHLAENQA